MDAGEGAAPGPTALFTPASAQMPRRESRCALAPPHLPSPSAPSPSFCAMLPTRAADADSFDFLHGGPPLRRRRRRAA